MEQIHRFKINDLLLLFDINSGTVHIIDELVYEILEYYRQYDDAFIVDKLKNRYNVEIITEALDELAYLQENDMLYSSDRYGDIIKKTSKQQIKAMCLNIAHDCNLRCKYCFASQGNFKGKRKLMTTETGKKALDFLIENSGDRHNLDVDFFGGEPLMNFETVKNVVNYGRQLEKSNNKKFRFTITTNAVLLDEKKMDFINANMDNIVLSLDGRKEVNDKMRFFPSGKKTYDVILYKIKKAVETRRGKDYYVRGTFTSENIDFTNDVLHLAELGFKNISVEPVVEDENISYSIKKKDLPEIFNEYERLADIYIERMNSKDSFNFFHFMIDLDQGPCIIKKIIGCGAGAEYIAVTPYGDIYPCHQFIGYDEFNMGNIIQNKGINKGVREVFENSNIFTKEECSECWARFFCSGGCAANSYKFNQNIDKPYEIACEMQKKRLECALYIKARLANKGGIKCEIDNIK